jgi:hypothetical protein
MPTLRGSAGVLPSDVAISSNGTEVSLTTRRFVTLASGQSLGSSELDFTASAASSSGTALDLSTSSSRGRAQAVKGVVGRRKVPALGSQSTVWDKSMNGLERQAMSEQGSSRVGCLCLERSFIFFKGIG